MIRLILGLLMGGAIGYGVACIPGRGASRGLFGCTPGRGLLAGAVIGLLVGATLGQSGRVANPSPHFVAIRDAAHFHSVIASNRVVLVDFYADWCGPCRLLKPTLHDLADAFHGRALIVGVDVDRCRDLAVAHSVSGIPDVRLFVDGRVRQAWVGGQDRAVYAAALETAVADGTGP